MMKHRFRQDRREEELKKFAPIASATTVVGYADRMVQDGYVFNVQDGMSVLQDDAWVIETGTASETPVAVSLVLTPASSDVDVRFYENAAYTGGTPVPTSNLNRATGKDAEATGFKLLRTPEISDRGLQIKRDTGRPDHGARLENGSISWVLKPNTAYLIQVVNALGEYVKLQGSVALPEYENNRSLTKEEGRAKRDERRQPRRP